jgi:hypothetical protein
MQTYKELKSRKIKQKFESNEILRHKMIITK